jgi:hypothetical protein
LRNIVCLRWLGYVAMLGLAGCATLENPGFDVPVNAAGTPTLASIASEIECELTEIATGPGFDQYLLEAHDVNASVGLNLDVTQDGVLAPTYSFLGPFLNFGGGVSLEEAREDGFTMQLKYSLTELRKLASVPHIPKQHCGQAPNTSLSNYLRLKGRWDMALTALTYADWTGPGTTPVFGGSVSFTVKKAITATGPTWTLINFKGPGQAFSASDNNVDKLTVAITQGPKASNQVAADNFLISVVQAESSLALSAIQNKQ